MARRGASTSSRGIDGIWSPAPVGASQALILSANQSRIKLPSVRHPSSETRLKCRSLERIILWLIPLLLALFTQMAWNCRFEQVPAATPVILASQDGRFQTLRGDDRVRWLREPPRLQIDAREPNQYPTVEIDPGEMPGASHFWIRMTASGQELEAGDRPWKRARMVVNYRDDRGELLPKTPGVFVGVGTFSSQTICKVLKIDPSEGRLYFTIQNLALDGTFTIEELEIRAVRNRSWFPMVGVSLGFGWFLWILSVIRRWLGTVAGTRSHFVAATAFFAAGSFLVFPGPWHPLVPLGPLFVLPPAPLTVPDAAAAPTPLPSPAPRIGEPSTTIKPSASLQPRWQVPVHSPPGTSVIERIFQFKEHFRPLLHLAAFAALTFIFSALLDPGKGWLPVSALGLASEAMQVAFGFGFDWLDVLDLSLDAAGIAFGLWLHQRWIRFTTERKWTARLDTTA
jgi:hypothetical protein